MPANLAAPASSSTGTAAGLTSTSFRARASGVTVMAATPAVDVALRDGSTIQIRPVLPADRDAICVMFGEMSPSLASRRGWASLRVRQLADSSVDLDHSDRYGVVATSGDAPEIVAHAGYVRLNHHRAEVAFAVAHARQGDGIGTLLLAQLADVAATNGIREFSVDVLSTNHTTLEVFQASGFPFRYEETDGLTELIFDTEVSAETVVRFDQRERAAARAALSYCLNPRNVAVIGASARHGTVGNELMADLIASGYAGGLYPINLRRHRVCGVPAFPTIGAVPCRVDLAVVVISEAEVLDVARQCGAAGTRALLVVSAFAEAETGGLSQQDELLGICRAAGMRLIGPNSLGLLNTDPAAPLNASLIRSLPGRGPLGLISQSGGVGVALTASADRLGLGLSNFVSIGHTADFSGNDLLAYWDEDPATRVILLYLESFGNPRRFARIARHVSAHKPILAVKSGFTSLGVNTEGSTTARLLANSELRADALFRQAGVIRTDSTSELLEAAVLLAHQPAPAGHRVALVSNSHGPAQLCADACRAAGLGLAELSPSLLSGELSRLGGSTAGATNPVNLTSRASATDYGETVSALAQSGEYDAVITLCVPSMTATARAVAEAVDGVMEHSPGVTFATVLMDRTTPPRPSPGRHQAARFMFPEEAARALGHAADWSLWSARPTSVGAWPAGARTAAARRVIALALAAGPGWLSETDVHRLLDCYGLAPAADSPTHVGDQALLAGLVQDADFGPLLVCGRSGGEIAVRITPVSPEDVDEMVSSLQGSIWKRTGSVALANPPALTDTLVRLGAMIEAHPEISALDIDPLSIGPAGATVRAARVRLADPPISPPRGALE